jgi:hypothetical protein
MKQTPEYAMVEDSNNTAADFPDNQHDLDRMKSETAILDLPEVKDIPGQEHIKVMPFGELADTTISSSDEEGAGILDFDEGPVGLSDNDDDISPDGDNSVFIAAGGDEDLDEDEDESADADIINDDDPEEDYGEADFITEDDEEDFDEDAEIDLDEDEADEDDDLSRATTRQNVTASTTQTVSFDESETGDGDADAEISEEEISLLENSGPVEPGSDTDNLNRSKLDQEDFDGDTLNEVASTQNVDGNDLDVPGTEMDDANEEIGEEDEENNVYSNADTDT